jgi:hypothetical protein
MAASLEMIATLEDANFHIWRQTRTGLLSYPLEPNAARAHLSASIYLQMALKPHIVHIVGHTEAHHAATADDVIDASLMARQAIENALKGQPDMLADPAIQARKSHLIAEAQVTLSAIRSLADDEVQDPLTDPATLGKAVRMGILDAPHLRASKIARGSIQTRIINGGCEAIDTDNQPLPERKRLAEFL